MFIYKCKSIRTALTCCILEVMLFSRSSGNRKIMQSPGSMTDEEKWNRSSQEEENDHVIPTRLASRHEV